VDTSDARTSGACLCGDVRLTLTWPSLWVAHCHCSMCRRAHGAAFVTWIGMPEAQVAIEDPHARLAWFASSADSARGFCARCAASLLFRSARWPGELHVAHGALQGAADRPPSVHAYWESHVDWAGVNEQDGLQRLTAADFAS